MEITRCNPTRSSPICFSLALAHQVAHIAIEFPYLGALDVKDHICRLYFGNLIAVISTLEILLAPWHPGEEKGKTQTKNTEILDGQAVRRVSTQHPKTDFL